MLKMVNITFFNNFKKIDMFQYKSFYTKNKIEYTTHYTKSVQTHEKILFSLSKTMKSTLCYTFHKP